ncbi:uncharacterized protein LOC122503786 [Leptopilina heterotoma]|uniref:uncharacterized protein LOC122503786 n=1 Tax=Leptopilina heterotoma TaxID=63436 RepID=UPI001CA7C5BD|nr:uncharacterized protein LOC122503786 [Leptopilina heterotoma]
MASSENSDFRMDFSDETEEQRAARNLLYYQQQSSKNVRSRTNSTSSLDSDKKRKCENQPDPFKPPLDPNTVRADQSGKKTGKKEVKLVKYENSNKGNCPVFLQRDPKSNDASKDLNHVSVGKIIHNLYPGKVVGIYPSGRGKVRVIMNGGRAANQIVSDPTLKSKGLIAIIPSSFVTCQGIINNIGLDISTEEILENAEIIGNYGKDCKIINALRFNRRKIDEKNTVTFEPSTTVLLTFQGTTIPERVSIYKGSSPVRPYIPDPRMCMNCLRFGHIAKHCRSKTRCQQCGGSAPHNDDTNPCTNASGPPRCANCNGPHKPSSKQCPEFTFQKEVRYYATQHKMSFDEAKEILKPKRNTRRMDAFNFSDFPDLADQPAPSSTFTQNSNLQKRLFSQATTVHNNHSQQTTNKAPHSHTNRTPKNSSSSTFFAANWNNGRSEISMPNGFALSNPSSTSPSPTPTQSHTPNSDTQIVESLNSFLSLLKTHITHISSNSSPEITKQNLETLSNITTSLHSLLALPAHKNG